MSAKSLLHLIRRLSAAAALVASAFSTHAEAAPLLVDVQPIMGPASSVPEGWMSALVRVQNDTNEAQSGTLSVEATPEWARGDNGPVNGTDVPFSVAPHAQVHLEVPVRGFAGMAPALIVKARAANGDLLGDAKTTELRAREPTLFDLTGPCRFATAVRQLTIPLANTRWGGIEVAAVGVSSASKDAKSGEPIVPRLASGYAAATVVLATGEQISLMGEEARAALSDWLLSGGALALVLERPEDLRPAYLESWAGGSVSPIEPPEGLRGTSVFAVPLDPTTTGPSRVPGVTEQRLAPLAETRSGLKSYSGGNLRQTPWGAAASFGLGELHLLAFRPDAEPYVSDPWVHRKLADLVRHTWERESSIALPFARQALDESRLQYIRHELDPNQGARWTIVVSALILLLYAGVAGPLNFYLARASGRPLRALWGLAVLSGFTLALVVGIGLVGRGVGGRARRISLVEAGAGMNRAAATRFRGLYTSSAQPRIVQPTQRGNVLDVAGDAEETGRRLLMDREGAKLANLHGRPWEVVVVQEDGFMDLGGGVSLVDAGDGSISVKNRLGRDLVAVVLMPGHGAAARFFRRIKDGETQSEKTGEVVTAGPALGAGSRTNLNLEIVGSQLDGCSPGLAAAWNAIEAATTRNINFWPDDVPVLIGQLDGGEGKLMDSGLPIEADRTLLRVVGLGGVP